MQPPVLHGGVRRRRGGRFGVLVVAALVAVGSFGAWRAWPSGSDAAVLAPTKAKPAPVRWAGGKAQPPRVPRDLVVARVPFSRGGFAPPLTAAAAILVDGRTGTVLWAEREHLRLPIASTTKIMTAALALERLAPNDVVTIDPSAPRAAPFREGLRAGERVPAWKLFYGLMLYSGNDDALALAIAAGRSRADSSS